MTISSLGIGSGVDLQALLDGLMKVEATQQNSIKTKISTYNTQKSVYQNLNSRFAAVQTASEALNLPSSWKVNKATSTDSSVTATATGAAISGTLSFKVSTLAAAHVMASSNTVSSLDAVVGGGQHISGSAASLGIGSMTAGAGLAAGKHNLEVTQATTGATLDGSAVAASTTIDASNDTFELNVNGNARTYSLNAGSYTRSQMVDELNRVSGGEWTASLDADNSIKFTTTREGSEATIGVTGGTALSSIGHGAGTSAAGTDGIVKLDGVATTITNTQTPAVLNSTAGSVTANFASGGLNVGTKSFDLVDFGDGKLSTIVKNINAANGGVTAAAVQVSPGNYRLQLAAKDTGVANALTIDPNAFSSFGLGTMQTVTAAADATLQVGSGPGAYSVTSASNTFKDVLPGVTMSVTSADPTKQISVNVGGDVDGLANKVQAMVDAANNAFNFIKQNSKYDAATKSGGALLGNGTASRLQQQLFSAITNPVSGASLNGPGNVGLKMGSDGTISFDKDKFKTAYATDPEAVISMFVEGGSKGAATSVNPGIAERIAKVGKSATNSVDGQITTAMNGVGKIIENLNKQVTDWDARLDKKQKALKAQFASLDTTLASLKSQSNWLAGQISGMSN